MQVANDGPSSQILESYEMTVLMYQMLWYDRTLSNSLYCSINRSCGIRKCKLITFSSPSILLRLLFFYATSVHKYLLSCGL